jgi:putative Mg2+ transporter-C (MgtC) family protein
MPSPAEFIDPTSVMLLKLTVATALGALIGTERAILARQSAGMRTFGLVGLGACLVVVISNYLNASYLGIAAIQPLQLAAAVVTGIGFLGGGLIIFHKESLHGVTTAASLWFTAALGMAVGFGMYAVAIYSMLLALIILTGMWYLENRFKHWFDVHDKGSRK